MIKKLSKLLSLPLIFSGSLIFPAEVKTGPTEFYQNQEQCSYSNSEYEDNYGNSFCIMADGTIKRFYYEEGTLYKSFENGKLNQSVSLYHSECILSNFYGCIDYDYYTKLYEWNIEGNQLVQYICESNDTTNCSGQPNRVVRATKRYDIVNYSNKNVMKNYFEEPNKRVALIITLSILLLILFSVLK